MRRSAAAFIVERTVTPEFAQATNVDEWERDVNRSSVVVGFSFIAAFRRLANSEPTRRRQRIRVRRLVLEIRRVGGFGGLNFQDISIRVVGGDGSWDRRPLLGNRRHVALDKIRMSRRQPGVSPGAPGLDIRL
jgi:hypothetical protein